MSKAIVEVTGFDELKRKIEKLSNDKDKRREILGILKQEAKSTVNAAKNFVHVSKKPHVQSGKRGKKVIQPGSLKKSIGVITGRKGQSRTQPTVYVGPRAKGNYDGYYGAWEELGHNIYRKGFKRKHKANSKYNAGGAKSRTEAHPFMEKAYNLTGGKVAENIEKQTARFIQRRIDKLSTNG